MGSKLNKIILVGNGFDIAHGLESRYQDFMFWLFNESTSISKLLRYNEHIIYQDIIKNGKIIERDIDGKFLFDNLKRLHSSGNIIYESELFHHMIEQLVENWCDLEYEYFKYLKNNYKNSNKIFEANNTFEILIECLIEYLKIQETNLRINENQNITKALLYHIFNGINSEINYTFINFNYTNILSKYIKNYSNTKEFQIHGCLNKESNIIFGYGDESHEGYVKFKEENNNGLLINSKSYKYLLSDEYKSIISMIGTYEYEVYIMGHSCGITDRMLLKQIFEHYNCKKIHLFTYGSDTTERKKDFHQKIIHISKHFDDNKKMIDKIDSFNEMNCKYFS